MKSGSVWLLVSQLVLLSCGYSRLVESDLDAAYARVDTFRVEIDRHHAECSASDSMTDLEIELARHERNFDDVMHGMFGTVDGDGHCSEVEMHGLEDWMVEMEEHAGAHGEALGETEDLSVAKRTCDDYAAGMHGLADDLDGALKDVHGRTRHHG